MTWILDRSGMNCPSLEPEQTSSQDRHPVQLASATSIDLLMQLSLLPDLSAGDHDRDGDLVAIFEDRVEAVRQ